MLVPVFLVVAVGLVAFLSAYRSAETGLASVLTGLVMPHGTTSDTAHQTFYFGLGGPHPLGLVLTPECTSALLIVPLVVVASAMVALRPRIARRVVVSLLIASAVLIIVNQLRLLLLVALVQWLGTDTGYSWGHTMLGSLVSVTGGACAIVLFVWGAAREGHPRRVPTNPGSADDAGTDDRVG
ncbi:archaeosortase/exosortase family protein [Amycolatopsis sp. H20-H5]|uniref:archaeosortase/exosortase family protein n=1 Tax=Amycolatopsis sp. H20-H5 TaxID=3046309 RepID=UPI002DB7F0FD|nr:archaeosortase/exosortase family protein [Amycolatopsis sp. H20-H5]MEC3980068.1 archaeosortase/exosortase family protein [Amycolatopsis sp. H20-H5]